MRTTEFMSVPIYGSDGAICMSMQINSKRKKNSRFPAGFTNADESLFSLFAYIISIKVYENLAKIA